MKDLNVNFMCEDRAHKVIRDTLNNKQKLQLSSLYMTTEDYD